MPGLPITRAPPGYTGQRPSGVVFSPGGDSAAAAPS
ncbi:uncharacterized protein METZ01_LOCUS339385 [marine metagenome]|uniref:Uncharacterized protein n=1 Tax=marine metagenome TaxID=408172 RepID=A0A382QQC4_9ZZZZ